MRIRRKDLIGGVRCVYNIINLQSINFCGRNLMDFMICLFFYTRFLKNHCQLACYAALIQRKRQILVVENGLSPMVGAGADQEKGSQRPETGRRSVLGPECRERGLVGGREPE